MAEHVLHDEGTSVNDSVDRHAPIESHANEEKIRTSKKRTFDEQCTGSIIERSGQPRPAKHPRLLSNDEVERDHIAANSSQPRADLGEHMALRQDPSDVSQTSRQKEGLLASRHPGSPCPAEALSPSEPKPSQKDDVEAINGSEEGLPEGIKTQDIVSVADAVGKHPGAGEIVDGDLERVLQAASAPGRSVDEEGEQHPLSPADIRKFENDGFIMLKGAFDPEVASACRDLLWARLEKEGILPNPSTWVDKKGIAEIYGIPSSPEDHKGEPWTKALSPRLGKAVNQLVGEGAWEDFGCGWWMVTFPGFGQPPWQAEGRWHIDGAHFRHYPHSREIGLLPIFLFSDVHPGGGGTAVLRGSHKHVAEILWKRAGKTGLKGPVLSGVARDLLLPVAAEDVVETVGTAGDVMLTHPLLLHARSTNLAPTEPGGVRFMCHPAVPLKKHLDFQAAPETFSAVQRTIWQSCPSHVREGGSNAPPIHTPDQCDHSAVKFSSRGRGARGRIRGRGRYRKPRMN